MRVYVAEGQPTIEGSIAELRSVAGYAEQAKEGGVKVFSLSHEGTPDHYERLLQEFIIRCGGSKIKGQLDKECLTLHFPEHLSDIVVSFFEFGEDSRAGMHCHFDQYGNEQYFDTDSIDMVIQLA